MNRSLEDFLDTCTVPEKNSRCASCRNDDVRAALERFYERKRDGTTCMTLKNFWEGYVRGSLGASILYESVWRHVSKCMGLNAKTGEPKT